MAVFGEPSERERLAWQVRSQIHRLAVDGFGADTVWVPIGDTSMTRPTVADALAGVRAAVLARNVAARMIGEYAVEARGAARTWEEIADALDLADDDPDRDVTAAERAFEQIAGRSDMQWQARARWTCAACGARVNDYGPYESHPNDREDGHAADCPRQTRALETWRAECEDDDW